MPVKSSEGEKISSKFVIVIAVSCWSGWMYFDVLESYHIVVCKVEKTKLLSSDTASATENKQPLVTTDRVGNGCP